MLHYASYQYATRHLTCSQYSVFKKLPPSFAFYVVVGVFKVGILSSNDVSRQKVANGKVALMSTVTFSKPLKCVPYFFVYKVGNSEYCFLGLELGLVYLTNQLTHTMKS